MIISDIESPFCPIPGESLFINSENKSEIEKIIDKIKYYSEYYHSENQNKKLYGSLSGSAVYASFDALKDISGLGARIVLLAANGCLMGYGSCRQLKSFNSNLKIGEDTKVLYEPQVNIILVYYNNIIYILA